MKTDFSPTELARILASALRQARRPIDTGDIDLDSVDALFAAGARCGLERAALQAALDALTAEKSRRSGQRTADRGRTGDRYRVQLSGARPLGSQQSVAEKRRGWLLASGGLVAAALLVLVIAIALQPRPAASSGLPAEVAPQAAASQPAGTIDVEAFRNSLDGLRTKVRTCARSDFNRLALALSIGLSARIGLDGKASEVKIVNDPLDSPPVRACLEKEIAAYDFPKPRDAPVAVDFQLAFEANPQALKNKKPSK